MKKLSTLLLFTVSISLSFAQVQRAKTTTKQSSDSVAKTTELTKPVRLRKGK